LQGHDYFRIMATTGHKTMAVFQTLWPDDQGRAQNLWGGKNF